MVWLIFEPGFEPAITSIVIVAAIVKLFWKEASNHQVKSEATPLYLAIDAHLHPDARTKFWARHYNGKITLEELLEIINGLIPKATPITYGSQWILRDSVSNKELTELMSSHDAQQLRNKYYDRPIDQLGVGPNTTLQITHPERPERRVIMEDSEKYQALPQHAALSLVAPQTDPTYPGGTYIGTDLSGADLVGFVAKKADYRGANFEGANLQGAHFKGSNFENANFKGANLTDVNFKEANLQGANLDDADLTGAFLVKANLLGASVKNTKFTRAKTKKTIMPGPVISAAMPNLQDESKK